MAIYRIQGKKEKQHHIYYEFDSEDEPLGVGGMGKVYKARCVNEVTGETKFVAVKFMYSDLPAYAIEKARREAAIQFRHDNLIEMLGFIETESKSVLGETEHHYHVVSELLEGVSLDSLLEGKLMDQKGHYVPYAEKLYKCYHQDTNRFAVEIVKNVLSGLMSMHDAGYIHRDIDPTNIMITTNGHIKLIDFGIAKKMNSLTSHDKHLTQTGQFVGKPEYAAPELVLGAIDEQNQTTDIYAVGILLFQCIVGHVPFEGDRTDVMQKQIHSPLPLRQIKHKGLRKIVAKATEKSRAKRYQSAAEFRVALDQLSADSSTPMWKPLYTNMAIAMTVVALTIGGVAWWKNSRSSSNIDPIPPVVVTPDYGSVVAALHNPTSATKAIEQLRSLSNQGDAKATFLLSRLLFHSKLAGDYCPDSIQAMQLSLHIATDNNEAHQLLLKATEQEPTNYQALYELACDYWKADQRTDAVMERNGQKAEELFNKAKALAQKKGDNLYVDMINAYLLKIKEWKANIQLINSH